jgi:LmbE family N-acetylglucosaminyl deacetylase
VANFVFLHAHPDDEAIATAGLMCAAVEAGHAVTVVFSTSGERGEVPADLAGHATLGGLRAAEALAAGELLGARVEFLGYEDSGPDEAGYTERSFAACDVEEAANRLLELCKSLSADVLVGYDEFGVTGHPDHRRTHVVAHRAAALAAEAKFPLWYYEGTLGKPQVALFEELTGGQVELRSGDTGAAPVVTVDVTAWAARKRAAMALHASQIGPESFFLTLPDDLFDRVWGVECYLAPGGPGPLSQFALAVH